MKNKNFKILLIIILSILVVAIIWLMIAMLNGNFKFLNFSKVSNELVFDETYNIQFNQLNIKSSAGSVYLKKSSTEEIRVLIYGEKDNTSVDAVNDNLSIDIRNSFCIGICFNNTISKVEVYLPNDYDKEVKIVNEYGDIEIDKFLNASFDIEEDYGDVLVLGAKYLKVKNEYGNVDIDEANEVDIEVSAGDVDIKRVHSAIINNDYGNIKIENAYNYLDLNNNCGNITIDNAYLNKNSYIRDALGNIKISNINEVYIDAKTQLGDVKIKNNYSKSDITLKIENECGDIKVDN